MRRLLWQPVSAIYEPGLGTVEPCRLVEVDEKMVEAHPATIEALEAVVAFAEEHYVMAQDDPHLNFVKGLILGMKSQLYGTISEEAQ